MGIKIENNGGINMNEEKNPPAKCHESQIVSLVREKNALIGTIVSLKAENQQFCFQLHEKKS